MHSLVAPGPPTSPQADECTRVQCPRATDIRAGREDHPMGMMPPPPRTPTPGEAGGPARRGRPPTLTLGWVGRAAAARLVRSRRRFVMEDETEADDEDNRSRFRAACATSTARWSLSSRWRSAWRVARPRGEVPRASHAGFTPGAQPAGPGRAARRPGREPGARTGAHPLRPMLVSPFTFYRGAALSWPPTWPARRGRDHDPGLRRRPPHELRRVRVARRRLVFGINDFDETCPGPWEWDVKRLAASFAIAGRDRGTRPRSAGGCCSPARRVPADDGSSRA